MSTSPALLLEPTHKLIVHPLVILHILDHHSRRQEGRVIGTLLGKSDENMTEITNAFAVPHAERGDEVAIGKDFNKKMLALHPRETVIGWYASTDTSVMVDTSSLIHEFYAGECDDGDPIHLVVDTRLESDQLNIQAFKSQPVIIQGEHIGNVFHELHLTLQSNEPENIALHEMIKANNGKEEKASAANLQSSMEQLHQLLSSTLEYVDQVVEGKVKPDSEKGRQISDCLAVVPRVRPEIFDKLFHNSLQDLLMVTYLSNITKTQLEIAEKLNASLGTL